LLNSVNYVVGASEPAPNLCVPDLVPFCYAFNCSQTRHFKPNFDRLSNIFRFADALFSEIFFIK